MTDDHIFVDTGVGLKVDRNYFTSVQCKYCKCQAMKNQIGEYLFDFGEKKCLTGNEKIIKDLVE